MPSEWWTYSIRDLVMFSRSTYFRLFELYHRDVWPAQILAVAAAIAVAWSMWQRRRPVTLVLLACAWVWVGWAFLLERYSTIHLAGRWYGAAFLTQGLLLSWLAFRERASAAGPAPQRIAVGSDPPKMLRPAMSGELLRPLVLFGLAVVIHPLIGAVAGRSWTSLECFGLTPDVTALATLPAVAFLRSRLPVLIIPGLWCLITASTLWAVRSTEWIAVTAFSVIVMMAIVRPARSRPFRGGRLRRGRGPDSSESE